MGLMDVVDMPQPVKFILNWGRRYSLSRSSVALTTMWRAKSRSLPGVTVAAR